MKNTVCDVCGNEVVPLTRLTCRMFGEQNIPEEYDWYVCAGCKPDFISRSPRVFMEN